MLHNVDLNGNINNMKKTKKDIIQEKIEKDIVKNNCKGIILSSVRSGKTKMILEAIKKHNNNNKKITLFIAYPNTDVRISWENEINRLNFRQNVIFSTFMSLEKNKEIIADYYIFDEAHALGEENQLPIAGEIAKNNKHVIFASGTYNKETLLDIKLYSELSLIVNYTTEQAIQDGIVSDFTIYIHKYDLNNTKIVEYGKIKKWKSTEKKECNRLGNKIIRAHGDLKMWAALERMRFINSSNSLIISVNNWIKENKNERFLLFSSDEKTGEMYNLPMFNSKSKDDSILKDFQNETINQLCLIKKASAGITFPYLQNILITAINSNGEFLEQMIGRSLLDDTEHSNIHIFVSNEAFQLKWLEKSLISISKNKVIYL